LVSQTLKNYDEILCKSGFLRVHKSTLVNITYVTNYKKKEGKLILKNGIEINVSFRKRDVLVEYLRK
jgi:two-component system LytT family response regulator